MLEDPVAEAAAGDVPAAAFAADGQDSPLSIRRAFELRLDQPMSLQPSGQ